jgi:hypothetical protein
MDTASRFWKYAAMTAPGSAGRLREECETMHKRIATAGALLLALMLFPGAAAAQSKAEIKREEARIESFVISNTIFTLYHELGHLLVDHQNMPVLGREEDVADNIASFILLNELSYGNRRVMEESALSWRLSGSSRGRSYDITDFYDEHSFDLQRSFQMVCMMVGRDANAFRAVADEWKMEAGRRDRCRWDYEQVADTVGRLFEDYRTNGTGQPQVNVVFEPAPSRLQRVKDILRGSFVLERIAEDLRTKFGLSRAITLRATACDEVNAFYDPSASEILYCYELADEFERQIVEQRQFGR